MSDGDREGTLTVQPLETPLPPPRLAGAPGSHSTLLLTYAWPDPVRTLNIHYGLFLPGVPTASCLAAILRAGRSRSIVFTPDRRDFSLPLSDESWSIWPQARSFLALGIEHILTGYDHILFLLTLLMLGGGLRSLIKMVTAFTVAHSLTLSLAVLDVVTLPGRLVESTIALSIV
ncbi:MAG: HupE/UreJ family protein, partial [Armatimonadetes bacterium]|nr:HupE/UreJ family protein [Armatimonadota bacterium]